MTPLRPAAGRVAHYLTLVAGAAGLVAAAIALVTAASSLAIALPQDPAWSSCSLLNCVGVALNNEFGIPGLVFGAVAAVVVTTQVLTVGGLVGVGAVTREVTDALGVSSPGLTFGSEGNEVTTYIPGVSPLPDKGDIIYLPTQGASKVTNVYYDPDTFHPDGTPGGVIIETELGSVLVVGIDLDEQ